jgi:hypothetical protein
MTSTPTSPINFPDTNEVSEVELTEINVMALVLSPLFISTVNFLMISRLVKFLTRLLTADSDRPISFAISTNGLLESD